MKVTVSDPILGERTIGNQDVDLIADQHRLLCSFRDDGRKPSKHLLDDIKVYDFILNGDEPNKLARQYLETADAERDRTKKIYVEKMKIAKQLGWFK